MASGQEALECYGCSVLHAIVGSNLVHVVVDKRLFDGPMADRAQAAWLKGPRGEMEMSVMTILTICPRVFGSKIGSMETKLDWLREELGLEGEGIVRMIRRFRGIFG